MISLIKNEEFVQNFRKNMVSFRIRIHSVKVGPEIIFWIVLKQVTGLSLRVRMTMTIDLDLIENGMRCLLNPDSVC